MASTTAVMIAYGGLLFTFTLHPQEGLADSPLRAGLTFAPYAIGFALTSLGVPALSPRSAAAWRRVRRGVLAGHHPRLSDVPADQAHEASGLFNTINMLGFAVGVATLGSAFLPQVDGGTGVPAHVTGSAFEAVGLGCAALALAGVGLVLALTRAEDRATALDDRAPATTEPVRIAA